MAAPLPAGRWRVALALVGAMLIATGFAATSALARLAYDDGTDPLSVNTVRTLCATVTLALVLAAGGARLALPAPARRLSLGLGVILACYSLSLYVAIGMMPVALAVLVFYTWPLLTGFGAWALGLERLTWLWPVAAGGGVLGLGLALGFEPGGLDPLGTLLAALASVGWTAIFLLNRRLVGIGDTRPVTLHMLAMSAFVHLALCAARGSFHWPESAVGWAALAANAAVYSVVLSSLFAVARVAGTVRTSLVMNIEPIASMVFTALLLDQFLTPIQVAGGVLVVAAISLARRASRPA